MAWTRFMDMHSGGRLKKPPYQYIYIESDNEDQAKLIFFNRFGHNPERVSCTCCGEDYSISSGSGLMKLSQYDRERLRISLERYCKLEDVLIIRASEITSDDLEGEIPQQGYIWHD